MKLTFLGGVGTVTGSKYLLETTSIRVLIDCGLFQGYKQLRLRNWAPLPVEPSSIDAVVLTHAHLDHSGYLPVLVRSGFGGPVICSPSTRDLSAILLPDSGFLNEKDAEFANRHKLSKHQPALPLYTKAEAEKSLERFSPLRFEHEHQLGKGVTLRLRPAGHILGAALVEVVADSVKIVFSGDLGRPNSATMVAPTIVTNADYLVVESTYGDRIHDQTPAEEVLADVVNRTVGRGGTVVIPAFAVGRAQELLYLLHRLKKSRRIADLPIFLDSPMAINASEVFCAHLGEHRLSPDECRASCGVARYVREAEESKALDVNPMPKVIVSASGMATGGRVLHHLKRLASDSRNTILFAGFQAGGTRGAAMVAGADAVKIHGQYVPVRAEVRELTTLSAHADADEILNWLRQFESEPRSTFITHGEPSASDLLRRRISEEFGWHSQVPEYRETVELA